MHIVVGGVLVTSGSTADSDGVLVVIVDAPKWNCWFKFEACARFR